MFHASERAGCVCVRKLPREAELIQYYRFPTFYVDLSFGMHASSEAVYLQLIFRWPRPL